MAINEHADSWLKYLYALHIEVVLHGIVKTSMNHQVIFVSPSLNDQHI